MFVKTFCFLLVLAVVAYGLPYGNGGNVDPGFGQHPNQGGSNPGFGSSNGQGGLPDHNSFHYGGGGDQSRNHDLKY